jgi:hypothetical protein
MARPERALDPEAGPVQRFASELRQLRATAGRPSYRELSKRAHYSPTALSEAAGGEGVPSLAVTLAYVAACGGDRQEWEARWRRLVADLAPAETGEDGEPAPYLGLTTFGPADADRFFGREHLVEELASRVAEASFLAVFGASGAGKSSVLRAGLIPAVLAGAVPGGRNWRTVVLTPGERSTEELTIHLANLLGVAASGIRESLLADPSAIALIIRQAMSDRPPAARLLIVVDQFEEVFTRCDNEEERAGFIRALLGAAQAQDSRARVVLGIRADFLTQFAVNQLALSEHAGYPVIQLDAMTTEELRRAITRPAARAGCPLDGDLMTELVTDAAHQHGVLPVLSQALLETWKRRHGPRLTLAAYQATGGIQGLLAQAAEAVYTALSPYDQRAAKALILRMVALGDATNRVELDQYVLGKLAAARVVVLGAGSAGLAHESLMQYWSRLRGWLAEEADGLRIHRQLADAAEAWEALDRDRDALYRGGRLTEAHSWAATRKLWLTAREQEFLHVSLAVQAREVVEARRRSRRLQRVFGSWVAP